MENLNPDYWNNRYKNNDIGWDLGEISSPLKAYIDQLEVQSLKILIPGAGNGYEAEYLFKQGFKNITVVDVSETALLNLKTRIPEFPEELLLKKNFFDLNQKSYYDLILEQTFFCALSPSLRLLYVKKMYELLKPKGKLVGLMFNLPLYDTHPPFGGDELEYRKLFQHDFQIDIMESCYNSIDARKNKELFVKLIKNSI